MIQSMAIAEVSLVGLIATSYLKIAGLLWTNFTFTIGRLCFRNFPLIIEDQIAGQDYFNHLFALILSLIKRSTSNYQQVYFITDYSTLIAIAMMQY